MDGLAIRKAHGADFWILGKLVGDCGVDNRLCGCRYPKMVLKETTLLVVASTLNKPVLERLGFERLDGLVGFLVHVHWTLGLHGWPRR